MANKNFQSRFVWNYRAGGCGSVSVLRWQNIRV